MVTIRHESHKDWAAREALLDRVFGEARFLKTCEQLRTGRLPSPGLALVTAIRLPIRATATSEG